MNTDNIEYLGNADNEVPGRGVISIDESGLASREPVLPRDEGEVDTSCLKEIVLVSSFPDVFACEQE